jgi:hypothetical protein
VGDAPRAKANEDGITITASGYNLTREDLEAHIRKILNPIELRQSGQNNVVGPFNGALKPLIRKTIEERKQSILNARNIAASLGYPMIRAGHVPVMQVPVRRILRPQLPPTTKFEPEPAIAEAEYQHILKIIDDMSVMMERSPTAFERLEEEHLRDFYLVVLNGHYEGRATGETFNAGEDRHPDSRKQSKRLHRGMQILARPANTDRRSRPAFGLSDMARHQGGTRHV